MKSNKSNQQRQSGKGESPYRIRQSGDSGVAPEDVDDFNLLHDIGRHLDPKFVRNVSSLRIKYSYHGFKGSDTTGACLNRPYQSREWDSPLF